MTTVAERPKPFLFPQFCKGCGRCIEACPKDCITLERRSTRRPAWSRWSWTWSAGNGCGLCLSACPSPYGLAATEPGASFELEDPGKLFGERPTTAVRAQTIPDERIPCRGPSPWSRRGPTPPRSARSWPAAGISTATDHPVDGSAELMAKVPPQARGDVLPGGQRDRDRHMMYGRAAPACAP